MILTEVKIRAPWLPEPVTDIAVPEDRLCVQPTDFKNPHWTLKASYALSEGVLGRRGTTKHRRLCEWDHFGKTVYTICGDVVIIEC